MFFATKSFDVTYIIPGRGREEEGEDQSTFL